MASDGTKVYPEATPDVARMFGITAQQTDEGATIAPADLPVPNLPVTTPKEEHQKNHQKNNHRRADPDRPASTLKPDTESSDNHAVAVADRTEKAEEGKSGLWIAVKTLSRRVAPYLLIFTVSAVVYYFFLANTGFNLGGIFKKVKPSKTAAPLTVKDTRLQVLQKDEKLMKAYRMWINQFYFEVSDPQITDPDADNSGNGLTNFQKFLLGLNPKYYDSLNLGMADSEALASGINPLTGGRLTVRQKELMDNYFDLEVINNRLAIEQLRRKGLVAGLAQPRRARADETLSEAPRSDRVQERRVILPPTRGRIDNSVPFGAQDAGGFDNPVYSEVNPDDLDFNTPGRLEIPALNINAPLIWTKDPKNFEKDLQMGVVHYPGTALPGQIGTAYISGHSSNYAWAKGNYNRVFEKLRDLPDNSSFVITVAGKDGRDRRFHYVVTHRKEYSPTDQEQFKNTGESLAALSTCWPPGSTAKRLVVFGKLTQLTK